MKLVFDSDVAYDAFQCMWMAMTKTQLPLGGPMIRVVHDLMIKLAGISRDDVTPKGTGRVLKEECEIELSDDERLVLLCAISLTSWADHVREPVRRTCRFLGASFNTDPLTADEQREVEALRRKYA